jgi:hypothetical protein
VRNHGAREGDGTRQICRDQTVDDLVAEVLGDGEHPGSGVRDDDVNAFVGGERLAHHPAHRIGVGHVERTPPEPIAMALCQVI